MFNRKKQTLIVITFLIATFTFAQQRESDTLKTDVIDVIKPYTPTISDAFKVKETPNLNDNETTNKKEIKYNIFSFPVASTFTPAKGKAAVVDKAKKIELFDNYASLGVGTYLTVLGEVYLNHKLGRDESISAYVGHHSSQNGIKEVLTNSGFSDSKINLNYNKRLSNLTWSVDGGFQLETYNWYGVKQPEFYKETTDSLDVRHSFYNAYIGGDMSFNDSSFKTANIKYRRFGDNYGSGENRFKTEVLATVPVQDHEIETLLFFDYIGGRFDTDYSFNSELKYGNFQVGLSPTYQLKKEDLTIDIGATATYLNTIIGGKNKFFIYPNISASYRIVNDIVIAYGSVKGGLIQNSYFDFTRDNPFVSPTLLISPTDQQFNASVGLKGKISNAMSYKINGGIMSEKGKLLFVNNSISAINKDYTFGNSFGVVYDTVFTYNVAGELAVDVNRNFTLGGKAEYIGYNTDREKEAWNLPNIRASVFLDYQITEKWFTGANLFYIGQRKDQFFDARAPIIEQEPSIITLEGYFDANVNLGYHINDRFSAFIKGNNLLGNEYEKWQNTPVQGIQFLVGATYKFNF